MPLIKAAGAGDIPLGTGLLAEMAGRRIALFNAGGAFYAIDDTCTHQGCPLSRGTLQGTAVTCPCHGSVFDLRTGEVLHPPAVKPVTAYRVVAEGQDIKIDVP